MVINLFLLFVTSLGPPHVDIGAQRVKFLQVKYWAILMHDISNNRAPSKISELFVRSNMIHSHYIPDFLLQVIFMSRDRDFNQLLLSFSRSQVYEFGTKFLLRYVNSAKTLSSVNYINY